MVLNPITPQQQLVHDYTTAWATYQIGWQRIDTALRAVVTGQPWTIQAGVHAKVVFVDGVYRSGLVRALGSAFAPFNCARAIFAAAGTLQPLINGLAAHGGMLSPQAAIAAVDVHGQLLAVLPPGTTGRSPRSFVSKFLHFHDPVVPIFDSTASTKARQITGRAWRPKGALAALEAQCPAPVGADPAYYLHVMRVLLLWNELAQALPAETPPTVKGIDSMLMARRIGVTRGAGAVARPS